MLKRVKIGLAAAMLRYIGAFVYLASGTFTAQPHTLSGQTNVTQLLHVTGTLSVPSSFSPPLFIVEKAVKFSVYTDVDVHQTVVATVHTCLHNVQLLWGVGGGGLAMGGYGFKNISILILSVPHRHHLILIWGEGYSTSKMYCAVGEC